FSTSRPYLLARARTFGSDTMPAVLSTTFLWSRYALISCSGVAHLVSSPAAVSDQPRSSSGTTRRNSLSRNDDLTDRFCGLHPRSQTPVWERGCNAAFCGFRLWYTRSLCMVVSSG